MTDDQIGSTMPTRTQIFDAANALRDRGQARVSIADILNHLEPGFTERAAAPNTVDLVGPTVRNTLLQAGRDGALTIEVDARDAPVVVFPAGKAEA